MLNGTQNVQIAALTACEIRILRKGRSLRHFTNPEKGYQVCTMNERAFLPCAKSITLRGSPFTFAKITNTSTARHSQQWAIRPQQPSIFLASDEDVDHCLKQSAFHLFFPPSRLIPRDEKNVGSALVAPRFAGTKEWPLQLVSSSLCHEDSSRFTALTSAKDLSGASKSNRNCAQLLRNYLLTLREGRLTAPTLATVQ